MWHCCVWKLVKTDISHHCSATAAHKLQNHSDSMSERVKSTGIDELTALCTNTMLGLTKCRFLALGNGKYKKVGGTNRYMQQMTSRKHTLMCIFSFLPHLSLFFIHELHMYSQNLSGAYASSLSQYITLLVDKCLHELSQSST